MGHKSVKYVKDESLTNSILLNMLVIMLKIHPVIF